jgi:hypothetical protein
MSSTSGFEREPGWTWPEDILREDEPEIPSSARHRTPPQSSSTASGSAPQNAPGASSSRQRHWRPRQCRICLDTVQPTFDVPSENLPGFLQSTGNVKYEDENGRLIRPCMCKGFTKVACKRGVTQIQAMDDATTGNVRRASSSTGSHDWEPVKLLEALVSERLTQSTSHTNYS